MTTNSTIRHLIVNNVMHSSNYIRARMEAFLTGLRLKEQASFTLLPPQPSALVEAAPQTHLRLVSSPLSLCQAGIFVDNSYKGFRWIFVDGFLFKINCNYLKWSLVAFLHSPDNDFKWFLHDNDFIWILHHAYYMIFASHNDFIWILHHAMISES